MAGGAVRYETGSLRTADGLELFTQRWLPEAPRAQVVLVHGLGEHSGRYEALATLLASRGYRVWTYDHRGHGRSGGERLFPGHFSDYVHDLQRFVQEVQETAVGRLVLFGHSMGATIVLHHALSHPEASDLLVVSGVSLQIEHNLSPLAWRLLASLSALVPRLPVKEIDLATLVRDLEALKRHREDPLVYRGKLSARMGFVLTQGSQFVRARMGELTHPILITHGGADSLVLPGSSEELYEGVSSTDKTLKIYPDSFHEIYNDYGREEVLEDLANWLEARL